MHQCKTFNIIQTNLLHCLFYEAYEAILTWIHKYYDKQNFQHIVDYTPTGLQQLKEFKELAKIF